VIYLQVLHIHVMRDTVDALIDHNIPVEVFVIAGYWFPETLKYLQTQS